VRAKGTSHPTPFKATPRRPKLPRALALRPAALLTRAAARPYRSAAALVRRRFGLPLREAVGRSYHIQGMRGDAANPGSIFPMLGSYRYAVVA
jgi:hypothetical protein